ncbi:hypothetical protein B9Z55_004738 [Caenorhabditis nigoni]|uniref:Uncharacterized protein n=1 Tax=Caenorhabditis nigoni TaxID=1611254 RepID=A0A2G5UXT2_9PELO|nr:hypothetical protein B9Z55_004738 [Caenorhabditis nigoni]
MSQTLEQKWVAYQDFASKAMNTTNSRKDRKIMARKAILLSEDFENAGFLIGGKYDIWKEHLGKCCALMESDPVMIQKCAKEYFLSLHIGNSSDFRIAFKKKEDGYSCGTICDVTFSGTSGKYYVKSHQNGPTERRNSVEGPPIQEILIYQFLSTIKVSGEPHFIVPLFCNNKKVLYYAIGEMNFTLGKSLTLENADYKALIIVDFLEFSLRLRDVSSNLGNFGQSDSGHPIIIDFMIIPKNCYKLSEDEIHRFWSTQYISSSCLINTVIRKLKKQERQEIILDTFNNWNMVMNIDESAQLVNKFLMNNVGKIETEGDLEKYCNDVKYNFTKIVGSITSSSGQDEKDKKEQRKTEKKGMDP